MNVDAFPVLLEIHDADIGTETKRVAWRERKTARCVLFRGDRIALMHVQNLNYHKLPGGGIEKGETVEEALHREAQEEVGSTIRIGKPLGQIIEWRSHIKEHQTSYCFMATEVARGTPEYTEEELSEGFRVEWRTLAEAVALLRKENPDDYEAKFIVKRDLRFLEAASNL